MENIEIKALANIGIANPYYFHSNSEHQSTPLIKSKAEYAQISIPQLETM